MNPQVLRQHVVVMRHGDRLEYAVPLWTASAERPWDPPLDKDGRVRAFCTGRRLRNRLGFPIHRVFVSPFLRCLQTAAEVIAALCAIADKSDDPNDLTSNKVMIDPSRIKVSIEYGLCEMLNSMTVRPHVAPKDGDFRFEISQCEAALPPGTIDSTMENIYKEMPKWEETIEDAKARYATVIKALADKYPTENLLLITHGDGVGTAVLSSVKDVDVVHGVDYCAYSLLQRPVYFGENNSFKAGEFVGQPEKLTGVKYSLIN